MSGSLVTDAAFVDKIYEASVLPEFWPHVIAALTSIVDGRDALLSSVRANSVRMISTSDRLSETWRAVFERFPGASNPRTERLLAARHAGFLADHDVFSEEEIETHPLYRELLIPRGYGRGTATAIYFPDGDAVVINIERGAAAGRFSPTEISLLNGLRPHIARSAMISARLSFERAKTAVETLAGLGLPACAVGRSGAVIVANGEFEGEQAFWTTRGGNRIALHDRRADGQLREALSAIDRTTAVRSLALAANGELPPAVLHLVPIRRAAHDLFGHAAAILVLTKANAGSAPPTPLLQALFDLTPTEARIAALIAVGRTVKEIAREDAKSVETVRNQVKKVLAKAGCRRQVDLARLLAQLVGGHA